MDYGEFSTIKNEIGGAELRNSLKKQWLHDNMSIGKDAKKSRRINNVNHRMTKEEKYQQMLQRIGGFRLLDDDFMTKCFEENIEATELVLRIVLNKPDIKVIKVQTQYSMKNIKGRSLRLDIYATDSEGKKYNIEIQRVDKGAGAKRARYNSSLIDSDILPAGFEVENLAETYVIFITENDVIGKNKPIYHIDRYIRETEEYFNDGSHIIYVNASCQDDSELGKLMHDFSVTEPENMNFKVLADATGYYKKDKEGIQAMCKAMEDMITDFVIDDRKEAAVRMLESGKLTNEEIARFSDLPLQVIEELANSLQTT